MNLARLAHVWLIGIVIVGLGADVTADDWPYWHGPQHDSVWRETGIVEAFPEDGPSVKWRVPLNAGYSGPSVAQGMVVVSDRVADESGERIAEEPIPGVERVVCFNAETGDELWVHEYEVGYQISYSSGPRTSPVIEGDRVWTLGAMGHLFCLDLNSGDVIWERQLAEAYECEAPVWGFSATPRIDGERMYCVVGGDESALVALNKNTGEEVWAAITAEEVGYAPPVLYERDGETQLIYWHDVAVNSLNPETGEIYWTVKTPDLEAIQRPSVTIVTPKFLGDLLYISEFYNGSTMLRVGSNPPSAEIVWRDEPNGFPYRDQLNMLMTTPVLKDGHVYGISGSGESRCLNAETGELVWRNPLPFDERNPVFGTVFYVEQDGRYFIFTDKGDLVIANLTTEGYDEIDRAHILDPVGFARGRDIVWAHPAFANRCMFARNDEELVCIDLAAEEDEEDE